MITVPGITKRKFSFLLWHVKNELFPPKKTIFGSFFLFLFFSTQQKHNPFKMTQAMSITQLCNAEEEKDETQQEGEW